MCVCVPVAELLYAVQWCKEMEYSPGMVSDYHSLLTDWRFTRGVEEQTKAFLDGFNEVVPLEWLRYFDEKELEVSSEVWVEGLGGPR